MSKSWIVVLSITLVLVIAVGATIILHSFNAKDQPVTSSGQNRAAAVTSSINSGDTSDETAKLRAENERLRESLAAKSTAISASNPYRIVDPGLTVEQCVGTEDHLSWRAWRVTNEQTAPLVVHRFVVNGEYAAPPGKAVYPTEFGSVYWPDTDARSPFTLSIGASQLFFDGYSKKVIFWDIYTDRGNFRYADGWGYRELTAEEEAQSLTSERQYEIRADAEVKADAELDAKNSSSGNSGDQSANLGPRDSGQGMGPGSKLFGHGGNVPSLIYVCDASGSMVGRGDDALKAELKRDIANLSPLQQFNVLIFHQMKDGSQYQRLADHLLMATPSAKAAAFDFVDRLPFSDVNNPIPALEEAFREQPQLIFLLSHGDFNNRYNTTTSAEVLAKINQLNAAKLVHVNTRLLLGDKNNDVEDRKDFEAIMAQIASQNGGEYKKLYSDEL